MATLQGWLNTSKEKSSVWVKPIDGILKENIFVNFESTAARDELVALLRLAFAKKASFTVAIDTADIQRSKSGTLFVKSSLAEVLDSMVETVRAEPAEVDPKSAAKAKALFESLAKRPTPVATSADEADDDEAF